jgi:16S rRNA (cytosine967-C5)-methyltransferase
MIAQARQLSYRILLQIATSDAHSDDLLHAPAVDALSPQDRNLTTTLVLGTLRWQLALDAHIREFLARPETKLSLEAATALRLGAFQLLHLDRVPAHAVLNDSVELIKQSKERGAAGMVNAVLRKIQGSKRRAQSSGTARAPESTPLAGEIAARWSHPAWMVERWARRYGIESTAAICRWDQEPAAVTLRIFDPNLPLDGLETEPGAFLANARRLIRGDPGPLLREGRIRMQDEASQLVGEVAAAAAPEASSVLDACAAPGGKTAILAERLANAQITAVDISHKRIEMMRRLLPAALSARLRFEVADAAALELQPDYDLILCDVPCSGTGTLARNPEIKLRLGESDLARQHARQLAILRTGLKGLKPGGRLVYSTCSLEPEENEAVVSEVLAMTLGFRLVPIDSLVERLAATGVLSPSARPRLESAIQAGFLRTVPGLHPCDGFFAAVLARD